MQGPAASARMHRRFIAAFECIDYRAEMYIKSAVKFAIEVVEVPGLPYLGGLVAGALKTKALDRVLDDEPPFSPVDLKPVGGLVSVRGVIRPRHAPKRSACESKGEDHRAIAVPGPVRHFRHHRVNWPAEMFQLIESVALCFDEIGMGMRADAGFTAKSPDGMGNVP